MSNEELVKRAQSVLFQNYRTQPIALMRGEGSWVYDADGKRYLDSIGATGQHKYQQGFGPLPEGFRFLDFGEAQQLASAISDKTCAVLLEPVQGEAGVMVPPRGYLARVRELCTKHGALMLLDEVQTGMGRTGAFFAHQHERIEPDAMTLAKGIAGGAPLGALLARDDVAKAFTPGTHPSPSGGTPLATAAACSWMDLIPEGRTQ